LYTFNNVMSFSHKGSPVLFFFQLVYQFLTFHEHIYTSSRIMDFCRQIMENDVKTSFLHPPSPSVLECPLFFFPHQATICPPMAIKALIQ
jgi:hypothetical protein